MGKIYTQITQQFKAAFEEAIDNSFKDIHKNVDQFYNAPGNPRPGNPPPGYDRTGQLAESPQINFCDISDESAHAMLSLDTSYTYNPSGRDTNTIYGYAEDGGLRGNGGFWTRSLSDIEKNLIASFGSRFS